MFEFFKRKSSGDSGSPKKQEPMPNKTTQEVLRSFMDSLLPDAVDTLLFRASMAGADDGDFSGFERYAARLLTEADGGRLRSVAVKSSLDLRWLNSTGMFWTNFSSQEVGEEGRRLVLRTESALSRLALVANKMEQECGSRTVGTFTEAQLSAFDDEALRSIASAAPEFFNRSQESNDLLSFNGVSGQRGGNWDLSTRFAKAAESVVLPYRLEYRFITDSQTGAIAVKISLPCPEDFPHSRFDEAAGRWVDCTDSLGAQAAAYALRLVVLVAACAFGCSIGINRVVVTGYDGSLEGTPLISMEFARMPFSLAALEAARDGRLTAQPGTADPQALLPLIRCSAQAVELGADGRLQPVEPLEANLSVPSTPLPQDTRELPKELQGVFQATRACELDVISPQDQELLARYRAIMDERDDSLLLAAAQLEEIVAQTKEADDDHLAQVRSDAPDPQKVSLLYCENVFCRFLTSLVDSDPAKRFCRMSDVGYGARSALVDINRDMGDNDSAEALCQEILGLAPTSTSPFMDLINTCANKEDFETVIEACKKALEFALVRSDISLLFYRLGYAFWQTKQYLPALAAYERVAKDSPFAGAMENERNGVLSDMGSGPAPDFDGAAVLRMAGVPLPPTDAAEHLIAKAAIELCDAGFPAAAAPAATALGMCKRNDMLEATAASLKAWVAQ